MLLFTSFLMHEPARTMSSSLPSELTGVTGKRKRGITRMVVAIIAIGLYHMNENRKITAPQMIVNGYKSEPDHGYNGFDAQNNNYTPGIAEDYIMTNLDKMGYGSLDDPVTCNIWKTPNATTKEVFARLHQYEEDIQNYQEAVQNFDEVPNLMTLIKKSGGAHDVCNMTRLHPDGVPGLFPSEQLSLLPSWKRGKDSGSGGFIEPLLPPMRSSQVCHLTDRRERRLHGSSLEYLIHDFEAMCHKLTPHSRLVLIDMGASFKFAGRQSQILTLLQLYEKMGFRFDHIYGFEATPNDASSIYKHELPERYMASYHWINVGVSEKEGDKLNPLHSIVKAYEEDDFIVVKMDIDTPSIEVPLFQQLLEDDVLSKLIDQFYFEHHVHMKELAVAWKSSMSGTIKESLQMFTKLRERGIGAHYWP